MDCQTANVLVNIPFCHSGYGTTYTAHHNVLDARNMPNRLSQQVHRYSYVDMTILLLFLHNLHKNNIWLGH